jgi:predicted dienelactone hydrolase
MKVGLKTGLLFDASRKSWAGDGPRPVRWTAWYPASDDAIEIDEKTDEFVIGTLARDAAVNAQRSVYSTVLLSHGTGGAAISLSWLATRLAAQGYIVIGPEHHGNTLTKPFHPAGFAAWWERARDLTFTLDALSTEGFLSGRIGEDLSVIGLSLGGYTATCLLGAVTDFEAFKAWAHRVGARGGPPQFPNLPDLIPTLMMDPAFLKSWERQSQSYRDERVRRAVLLAPAPPVRAFTPESLSTITEPVTIYSGRR